MSASTSHELSERITRLKERINTIKAEYNTGFERIESRLAEDAARRDAETARRETRLTMAGMIVAAVAILGVLIRITVARTVTQSD